MGPIERSAGGQLFTISTSRVISALTVDPAAGLPLAGGGPFVRAANGGFSSIYRALNTKWYRQFR